MTQPTALRQLPNEHRLGRGFTILPALLGLLGWLIVPTIRASDTNGVIESWMAAQTNLQTWQADFVQSRTLKALKQPILTTGRVWFARPDKFRWELGTPAQTIAVQSDDVLYVVYPELKRAERYPMGPDATVQWRDLMSLLQSGFPESRAALDERFRLRSVEILDHRWRVRLEPRRARARRMMPELRVALATNDFALLSTTLIFGDGSSMRSDYTNAVLNPQLDHATFEWSAPPEFTVTEPMKR